MAGTETAVAEVASVLADPGFAEVSEGDWEAAADKALRGEPLASLVTSLLDGVETAPLYTPHRYGTDDDPAGLPGEAPYLRGASASGGGASWEVRQTHDVRPAGTPDAVAVDTTSGVDAVTVARGWHAEGDAAALEAGIGDAAEAGVTVHLQAGASPDHARALLGLLERRGVAAEHARSWLGIDPVAAVISGWSADATGDGTADGLQAALESASLNAADVTECWPNVVPLETDGSVFADAGAADATELAAMLAVGVAWLRALCDAPEGPALRADTAAQLIGFTMSAGPDPFVVTAKCRALRLCWARVLKASDSSADGRDGLPMRLHAVTSTAMLSRQDPWVNMLRATAATFGAANGGADAITVRPFDSISDGPASTALGWRVAANTQLILRDESRIGSVIDPAGGSWYLEDLTQSMAAAAWERFRQIDAAGGICTSLADGQIEATIASERERRNEQLESGDSVLVGVTEFAPPDASSGTGPDEAPGTAPDESEPTPDVGSDASSGGLGVRRWAAPFESEAAQQ